MTLHDNAAPRKRIRMGLFAPFAVLIVAVAAWTVGWSWMRAEVFRDMDANARELAASGIQVAWTHRSISGFPFRLDLDISGPRLRESGGWGLAAPRLKAEAFVFAPRHWVVVAPDGATLIRRRGGAVIVRARVLRASLSDAAAHPPRLSVEGLSLTFAPGPDAEPVALTSAAELHLHAKSGPDDQGAAYVEIDGARTAAPGVLNDIAAGAPVTLIADVIYSHAHTVEGNGFADALRRWNGTATVRSLRLTAGNAGAETRTGALSLDGDGRLRGTLALTLKQGPRLMTVLAAHAALSPESLTLAQTVIAAHSKAGKAAVTLDFLAGRTTLGPVSIGPAPRVY